MTCSFLALPPDVLDARLRHKAPRLAPTAAVSDNNAEDDIDYDIEKERGEGNSEPLVSLDQIPSWHETAGEVINCKRS